MDSNQKPKNVLETIGNTPLVELDFESEGKIYAKLEAFNATGSIKDRMAYYMVKKAEEKGLLKPGSTILEVTSGNTGIAFAMISAVKGYKFTAVMPGSMSKERIQMMKAFGANVVLTPAEEDMDGALKKYNELASQNPDAWLPRQFENEDNWQAHYQSLGREISESFPEGLDAFAAGTGTGGTLVGVAKALKEKNKNTIIAAVEPEESAVMSGKKAGLHKIQGIGEGFIPEIVQGNLKLIDKIIAIKSEDAMEMSRRLARQFGIMAGISSGANVSAALKIKKEMGLENVATVLPDRGERYLSENLFG